MDDPLAGLTSPYVLLEDRLDPHAPARVYREPVSVVAAYNADGLDAAFAAIETGLAKGLHAAGYLAYELGYELEPSLAGFARNGSDRPLLWFGLFAAPQLIDPAALDAAFARRPPPQPLTGLEPGLDAAGHAAKIERILELIAQGDIYQANLTFPLRFECSSDPLALYGALRAAQPVAFGGFAALEELSLLSVSPELWVRTADDRATTRPMKGTTARLTDPQADAEAREALATDPKQRAENLMITDLLRNDLSRIATPGTVRTPALFTVESYPSFHALTSTVTAELRPQVRLREKIAALFPCGSIVGAPKIRAAEVIAELEATPRGVYTGSFGSIAPNGDMGFNVAIRTAVIDRSGRGVYGVGGGVVADSSAQSEYDEALLKARVLTGLAEDYGLIETFRWSDVHGFIRLERHLQRMAGSARELGFAFDASAARARLDAAAPSWAGSDQRVRLALSRDGALDLTWQAIAATSPSPLKVMLAAAQLDRGDPFLRHKTTRREIYESAFAEAAERGLDEAIFLNREGLVTEASRNSIFVRRDGRLVTPPLDAGLLPGVLRAALLEAGKALEEAVTLEDLSRDDWFLGNSLHGLRAAAIS